MKIAPRKKRGAWRGAKVFFNQRRRDGVSGAQTTAFDLSAAQTDRQLFPFAGRGRVVCLQYYVVPVNSDSFFSMTSTYSPGTSN